MEVVKPSWAELSWAEQRAWLSISSTYYEKQLKNLKWMLCQHLYAHHVRARETPNTEREMTTKNAIDFIPCFAWVFFSLSISLVPLVAGAKVEWYTELQTQRRIIRWKKIKVGKKCIKRKSLKMRAQANFVSSAKKAKKNRNETKKRIKNGTQQQQQQQRQ